MSSLTKREVIMRIERWIARQRNVMAFHEDPNNDAGGGTLSRPYIEAAARVEAYQNALSIVKQQEIKP